MIKILFKVRIDPHFFPFSSTVASSKKSLVWKYYQQQNVDMVVCLICKRNYSRKGRGTSSLWNHLKSLHRKQFEELAEEQAKHLKEKDIENAPLQKELGPRGVEKFAQSIKFWDVNNPKSKTIDRFIAETLILDDLPFSRVDDLGFTTHE